MKKSINVGIALVLISSSSLALAAVPGAYLGAGLGKSNLETPRTLLTPSQELSASEKKTVGGLGGRVFAGYNFNQYIGLEMGLGKVADSKYTLTSIANSKAQVSVPLTFSQTSLDLVGKAYLPVSDTGFNLYALGGAAAVYSNTAYKVERSGNTLGKDSQTVKAIRPVYGAGISYAIPNSSYATNLEFSRVQGRGNVMTDRDAIPTANMLSLNVSYNLPL